MAAHSQYNVLFFAKTNRRKQIRILNSKNVLQLYYLFTRLSNVPFYRRAIPSYTELYRIDIVIRLDC